ncbi:hypothetical protein Q3C01_24040 [Bradyrhizobium sp. UFLA05-109]
MLGPIDVEIALVIVKRENVPQSLLAQAIAHFLEALDAPAFFVGSISGNYDLSHMPS